MTEADIRPRPGEISSDDWSDWAAWDIVPAGLRADLDILFRFNAAVRAVADHPAAAVERKEAALAALAMPFSASAVADSPAPQAIALAELLTARGIDSRPAWQVLQAAGQDLRKTRYRDWSELLTWCRFSAAPLGSLAASLTGVPGAPPAVPLAIALQLLAIVESAPSQYRWLGRVYLPERWFTEAGAEVGDLEFARISAPLAKVRARALDQAATLLDEALGGSRGLDRRTRSAIRAVALEAGGIIAAERRAHEHGAAHVPSSASRRRMLRLRAWLWAVLNR